MLKQNYDPLKLKGLFHYLIKAAGARPGFGVTELYKLAWLSDAEFFALHGRSITGETYIRQEFGPVPRHGEQLRTQLVSEGLVTPAPRHAEEDWLSLLDPDLSIFSTDELATIDWWLKSVTGDLPEYGWEIAGMFEPLPYAAHLASRIREPDATQHDAHAARARQLGLI